MRLLINFLVIAIYLLLNINCNDILQHNITKTTEILKKSQNNDPRPPILLLPGLVSSRLVAWKRKQCRGPDINIQDLVWLNLQKLVETMTYDPHCWLDCLKLDKNGSDPIDCKVRPDEGLSAIGELSPGNIYTPPATSIFTSLIRMLADELGYDSNNIIGAPYDWRLSPMELENRDSFFTTLKFRIETAVRRHRRPAIIMAHSMGTNLFIYFCDWLRYYDKPSIGWERWVRKHIWAYVGFAAPLLGAPGSLKSVLSGHTFGLTISEAQARELEITFSSTHFLNPRSTQGKFTEYEFNNTLVTIKSSSGNSKLTFNIGDVENGEIFRWVGNMLQDQLMLDKYRILFDFYDKDPLKPLKTLYKRPPIKHVIMVYGIDLPTEVGYTYRIPDMSNNIDSSISLILDEILYEEPCIKHNYKPSKQKEQYNSNSHIDNGLCLLTEDYTLNYTITTNLLTKLSINTTSHAIVSTSSQSTNIDISSSTSITETNSHIHNDDNHNMHNKQHKTKKIKNKKCYAEIYSSKSKKNNRKKIRNSTHYHSGDVTVPYISLSFAKTWLDDGSASHIDKWEDHRLPIPHRNILDSWAPSTMSSAIQTVDPAVDIFYSKNNKNGDTTVVMEVYGIDHLDIAKHSYVHGLIFENLLPKMAVELCLNNTCEPSGDSRHKLMSLQLLWKEGQKYLNKIIKRNHQNK